MATSAKGKAKLLATELLFVIVYSIYTGSRSLSRLFSRLVNRVKSTYDVAATEVDLGLVDVMNFNINHEERENDVVVSLFCTLLYYYLMCEYSLVHPYQQLVMMRECMGASDKDGAVRMLL